MELPKLSFPTFCPTRIRDAAYGGKTQDVLDQLDSYDMNDAAYGVVLLECCASHDIQPNHVDLARALLDRGPDLKVHDSCGYTPLHYAARGNGYASVDMVALLLDAHANVFPCTYTTAPLVLAIRGFCHYVAGSKERHLNCRRIARLLLRAGAPLSDRIFFQLNDVRVCEWAAVQEDFLATEQLIFDLRAAGSPQAYRMESRKRVLLLRSLALKGRAEPRDARMTFLVASPNEIAWKILEYWRTELDC